MGRPVPLEILQEARPVLREPMALETCKGGREAVVDANNG